MAYSLSRQDEKDLLDKINAGDEAALENLINANMGIVYTIARKYLGFGVELKDLTQLGIIGLIEAARSFDQSHDNAFITYAVHFIRKNIYGALVENCGVTRVSVDAVWLRLKLRKAIEEFASEYGRMPTDDELTKTLGWTQKKLDRIRLAEQVQVDIDAERYDGTRTYHDVLKHNEGQNPESDYEIIQTQNLVAEMLATLPEVERTIIRKLYGFETGEEMSLVDVAQELGVTKQAIWIRKKNALRKLRSKVNFKKSL